MKSRATQSKKILHYLETHKKGITPMDALEKFGCFRLSGRIFDLRQMGYPITTIREVKMNQNGEKKTYARYILES